jgi:hypothetical protein
MFALSASTTDIVVSIVSTAGVVAAAVIPLHYQHRRANKKLLEQQKQVHEDNRMDHMETASKVDSLLTTAVVLSAKVESVDTRLDMVHDDLRHVKHSLRDHSVRIHDLEVS